MSKMVSSIEPVKVQYLPNQIRETITAGDPFFLETIQSYAQDVPARHYYPSLDIGAGFDFAHGLLFDANRHIMVDPIYARTNPIDEAISFLQEYNLSCEAIIQAEEYCALAYFAGSRKQILFFGTDAGDPNSSLERMISKGLSSLMMKGNSHPYSQEHTEPKDALPRYRKFLVQGGLYLVKDKESDVRSSRNPHGISPEFGEGFTKVLTGDLLCSMQDGVDQYLLPHALYKKRNLQVVRH